jgi:hypothetical protein
VVNGLKDWEICERRGTYFRCGHLHVVLQECAGLGILWKVLILTSGTGIQHRVDKMKKEKKKTARKEKEKEGKEERKIN